MTTSIKASEKKDVNKHQFTMHSNCPINLTIYLANYIDYHISVYIITRAVKLTLVRTINVR